MFQASNLSCYDKSQQAQGKLPICQYWHEEDTIEDMLDIDYYNQNYLLALMNGIDFLLRLYSKYENKETAVLFTFDKVRKLYQLNQLVGGSDGGGIKSDNGIKGDYFATYGITDMPNGVIESVVGTNNLNVPAGIVLKAAGSDTLTTLASETVHQTTSTSDFTLFYVAGEMLECGDVVYSEIEPLGNGVDNYQAWFNPQLGKWQFRSNDTGNVWREAVATPLCDCYFSGGALTRIDFIGYRVLNKQTFGGDFLPLSGGTMTGDLTFEWSGQYMATRHVVLKSKYYRTDTETFVYSDVLTLLPNGEITVEGAINSGALLPKANNIYQIGSPYLRWNSLYVNKINNGADIAVPTSGGTMVVATPPTDNGTYVLKCVIADGVPTVSWVKE